MPQKPSKMTTRKGHQQSFQLGEHPNLRGNGSTQAVLPQKPTAKEAHRVKDRISKDDKKKNSLTGLAKM